MRSQRCSVPLFGAHISIAGGVDKAPERGRRATCDVIQIFTKSNVQWAAAQLDSKTCTRFAANLQSYGISLAFAHASYLINLCSSDSNVRRRSREALAIEMSRCAQLGLPYLVMHPGSCGTGSRQQALDHIIRGIKWAVDRSATAYPGRVPTLLLETTAARASEIGGCFAELGELLNGLKGWADTGICFDTCHVFAAGYDLRTAEAYSETMEQFDRAVGCHRIFVFHLNDSAGPLGARSDRHQHIGRGKIGLEGFRAVVNDTRFATCPMIIETPKGKTEALDKSNLRRLRSLIAA
ncbi:MAG: deoxyribonuclease IV [Candidatus Sumerlaeia bacterium]|nr:deoxyribonuclease IV [Candidatus Sumerlaeia bacterium]